MNALAEHTCDRHSDANLFGGLAHGGVLRRGGLIMRGDLNSHNGEISLNLD
jgi:hypothetical protein